MRLLIAVCVCLYFTLGPGRANAWNDIAMDKYTRPIKSSTFRPVYLDTRDCLVDLNGFDIATDVLYDSYGRLMEQDAPVYDSAGYEVNRYCNR